MLFPDHRLAARLERFRAELQVSFARTCGRLYPATAPSWEPVAGGFAVYTHPGSPINRAQGLGMTGPVSAAELDVVEAFYFDRGAPSQVDITPYTHQSLIDLVGRRGYRLNFCLNMLCRPVLPGDADLVPAPGGVGAVAQVDDAEVAQIDVAALAQEGGRVEAPDSGVKVAPVAPADIPAWAELVTRGFGYAVPPGEVNLSLVTGSQDEAVAYLAQVDGVPAGGGALQMIGTDAYLGSTAVLPQFRRRGLHRALLNARLAAIARAGGELIQVQTSAGSDSQRNLMRAGFQVAYSKMMLIREKP